ncbi:MAG TPA: hypothetical protein VGM06_09180 [Polyangiaceae bacterium]
MRSAFAAAAITLVFGARAHAKPPPPHASPHATKPAAAPKVELRPAPPLPMLPSVARVRVEVGRDHVVVDESVHLPRGDWVSGGLDLYVAFGSPGTPKAIDARLFTLAHDANEPKSDDAGQPVPFESAVQRLANARLLLGRPLMAGVVLHVKEADLRHAYAVGDVAELRIRSLLAPPSVDAQGARDVVVRLGISGDVPLTLGRIQVMSAEGRGYVARAEARLCGPEAVPLPMAVTLLPKEDRPGLRVPGALAADGSVDPRPIAPVTAVRHASDDLCIRWFAPP